MAMAEEVAIALVIHSSLRVLSEGKILSCGLRDQINAATNDLKNKFITLKLLESGTKNDQQSSDGSHLLGRARDAVHIADMVLLEASQPLKSHKGRLAKIRALVHFMSPRIRGVYTEKMARDFIARVMELSTQLSQMRDLSRHDLLHLDENGSSRNAHRGDVNWNGKIESDIVGREGEADKLLAWLILKDGDQYALRLRIVSVVGEEPIGKTALVRSIYNRPEIDCSFQCRVWVHVPEEFTLTGLLVKIVKQLPLRELKDLELMEQEILKKILHESLVELRYLIVFDNLHEVEVLDELMIFLPDSMSGSRVIVTTRDLQFPSLIDPWGFALKLDRLDADQSKRLLGECGSVAEDPELTARILRKCSGSPPGILLLGGLAAASVHFAPAVVDQLADNPTLLDIMSLSYRKLPSLLKPCLLYLCLFPKDSEISTRRLFRLWLAEEQVLSSTVMECFEELVGRNLLHVVSRRNLSGRPKSCRMPSFLHDFLCKMATQLGLLLQIHSDIKCTYHSEESKVVNGCLWIVRYGHKSYHQESQQRAETGDNQHGGTQLRHLRSYVSFNKQKWVPRSTEVEELLRPLIAKGECGLLRVLDLEGVYKPKLPDGLGNVLLNLRYLGLRWTILDSIPESVGNMSHLETLDLKHTNLGNLPSSIWKVKSLQHLYMNEVCFSKSIVYRHTPLEEYPSNLQTLWGLYIEAANSPVLDLLSKLYRIQKLGLTCYSPVVKEATECISNLPMLQSLKLRSRDLFKPSDLSDQPSDLNLSNMTRLESLWDLYLLGRMPDPTSLLLLPPNLKILTLSMSGLVSDPMPVLGLLTSLEILNLFAGSYAGSSLYFGTNSFPCLRVLKLWMLEEVEEAYVIKTALCCLEELEIKSCGLLTSIDSLSHIESLKQIRLIKVQSELAWKIKHRLTPKVFIKENQLVSSAFY